MKEPTSTTPAASTPLDRLVGKSVIDRDGKSVGRLHELRVDVNGDDWTVTHALVGVGGLLERLGLALKLIVGRSSSPYVVPVDQMDFSDPKQLRIRRARADLRRE
jgi:sporulation protein YlmC with PRC-barrel domain